MSQIRSRTGYLVQNYYLRRHFYAHIWWKEI